MKLETRKDGLIVPSDAKDLPFFEHCSGGLNALKKHYFESHFVPVFYAHQHPRQPHELLMLDGSPV